MSAPWWLIPVLGVVIFACGTLGYAFLRGGR